MLPETRCPINPSPPRPRRYRTISNLPPPTQSEGALQPSVYRILCHHASRCSMLTCAGSTLHDSLVHCLSLVLRLQTLTPHGLSQGCQVTAPGREAQMRSRPAGPPVARPALAAASLSGRGPALDAGPPPLRLLCPPQTRRGMQSPSPPLRWPTLLAALAAVQQPRPLQRVAGSLISCRPLRLSCPPVTQRSTAQQTRRSRARQTLRTSAAQQLARDQAAKVSVRWGLLCCRSLEERLHVGNALYAAVQACTLHGQHTAAAAAAAACGCMHTLPAYFLTGMA